MRDLLWARKTFEKWRRKGMLPHKTQRELGMLFYMLVHDTRTRHLIKEAVQIHTPGIVWLDTDVVNPVNPKDVCKCGDYRYQHKNGIGQCVFNDFPNHGHSGGRGCDAFDLSMPYQPNPSTD